ncbi:MAG: hypothetical protein ISS45_01440 [Candidatus Omnitrophica bacterium]|nr:hypothetical protein [Candidatus Omnitrophota bacterium]
MNIKNHFLATGIGSLPFQDKKKALDFIIESFQGHIPFWPQLPKISFLESMHVQFSEGFPGRVIDLDRKNIYINSQKHTFIDEFEKCYNAINTNQLDYFSLSPDYAVGFHEFIKQIPGNEFEFIKGQIIGPISYGMTLLDDKKKPLLFNTELNEIIPQFLSFKARWQVREFKKVTKANIIMFIDEPYLVAVGTNQFASLNKPTIVSRLNSIIDVLHEEKVLVGIHCCGNTDWSICLETNIDILSFDAFGFLNSLFIYKDSLNKFIQRDGVLACGIVPNNQDYNLDGYLKRSTDVFKKEQLLLKNGALITPSCGCGTVSEDFAKKAHLLAIDIAEACPSIL